MSIDRVRRPGQHLELGADDVEVAFGLRRHRDSSRIFEFSGRIVIRPEGGHDREVDAGSVTGVFVPEVWSAAELLELAEIVGDDVYRLAKIAWEDDDAGDGLRLATFTELHASSWVAVRSMEVDSKWRGRRLAYHALRELTRWCASSPHTMLVTRPYPATSDEDGTPSEGAIRRLQRYWARFGLRSIGETGIFAHGFELHWPDGSWMQTRTE